MSGSKALILVNSFQPGGAELFANRLAIELQNKGLCTVLMATSNKEMSDMEFSKLKGGIKLQYPDLSSKLIAFPFKVIALRRLLVKGDYTHVVSFLTNVNILLLLASVGLKLSSVVCERSSPYTRPNGFLLRHVRNLLYRRSSTVVVQSQCGERYYKRRGIKKIAVIPNLIRDFPTSNIGTEFVFEPNKKYLLTVGRLIKSKNISFLIRAFEQVRDLDSSLELVIVGKGPLLENIENQVGKSRHRLAIHIHPPVERLDYFYRHAHIFLFSSLIEGFPNVLIEAMSFGLPLIALDVYCGPSDIVENGVNGFLLPANVTVEEYSDKISILLNDIDLRNKLGNQSIKKSLEYSVNETIEKWLDLMCELSYE